MKKNKIYILGIVKLSKFKIKIIFIRNFNLCNVRYKGFFIDNFVTDNSILFDNFKKKDFNKWYRVEVDVYGNLLYLYYKNRSYNL